MSKHKVAAAVTAFERAIMDAGSRGAISKREPRKLLQDAIAALLTKELAACERIARGYTSVELANLHDEGATTATDANTYSWRIAEEISRREPSIPNLEAR